MSCGRIFVMFLDTKLFLRESRKALKDIANSRGNRHFGWMVQIIWKAPFKMVGSIELLNGRVLTHSVVSC